MPGSARRPGSLSGPCKSATRSPAARRCETGSRAAAALPPRVTVWAWAHLRQRACYLPHLPGRGRACGSGAGERPLELGEAGDAGSGGTAGGLIALGGRQPAGLEAEPRRPADVGLRVVTDHPGVIGGTREGGERVLKDARVGLGRPDEGRIGGNGGKPQQVKLGEATGATPSA